MTRALVVAAFARGLEADLARQELHDGQGLLRAALNVTGKMRATGLATLASAIESELLRAIAAEELGDTR